jgi:hypothetical protein
MPRLRADESGWQRRWGDDRYVGGRRRPSSRTEAREIFMQRNTTNPAELQKWADAVFTAGLRVLADRHHPDHGGKAAEMRTINEAVEWLRGKIQS